MFVRNSTAQEIAMTEPERDGDAPLADRDESQQKRDTPPVPPPCDWTGYPPEMLSSFLDG
jgi:hypothetical protein